MDNDSQVLVGDPFLYLARVWAHLFRANQMQACDFITSIMKMHLRSQESCPGESTVKGHCLHYIRVEGPCCVCGKTVQL